MNILQIDGIETINVLWITKDGITQHHTHESTYGVGNSLRDDIPLNRLLSVLKRIKGSENGTINHWGYAWRDVNVHLTINSKSDYNRTPIILRLDHITRIDVEWRTKDGITPEFSNILNWGFGGALTLDALYINLQEIKAHINGCANHLGHPLKNIHITLKFIG